MKNTKVEPGNTSNRLFSNHALLVLLLPLVIEQFLAVTVGMADTMMVSRAGEAAVSGVSLVDMINNVILNVFAALATGGAVITSQYLGARQREKAGASAAQLVVLSALCGAAIMALCLLFGRVILRFCFGSIESDVMSAAWTYFFITALSYPFLALYNAGAAIFRSIGNSRVSMQVSMVMNLLNIVGNAICIFGLGMGVEGVAIPSLVSRAVAALMILSMALGGQRTLHLERGQFVRLERVMAKNILRIGIPSAMENSVFQMGRVLVVSIIAAFGTTQIAANAVANNLDAMCVIPGQAFSLAMISVVGRCVGAGDFGQARYYTRKLLLLDYLIQGADELLIFAFLKPLISLYSLSGETMDLAWKLVAIHALVGLVIWPASFVLPNALRAAGDVSFTMVVSIASMVVWRLGFSYVLAIQLQMGALGVWYAMVVDWGCRVVCFGVRWLRGGWEKKARLNAAAAAR